MDLARLCDLNVDKRLPAFNIEPWDRPAQPPGELSRSACVASRFRRTMTDEEVQSFLLGYQLPSRDRS